MSRVGKKPIAIPEKVNVSFKDRLITVKGSKGTLSRTIHDDVDLKLEANQIQVEIRDQDRKTRALQGLTRSLVNNMVTGVSSGFERVLEINGIGYRAEVKGQSLVLNLGFSNPVNFKLPDGVSASVDRNTIIKLSAIDKEKLGQTAASIRKLRPPEPYKGKGIRYVDEYVRKKAGKAGV
ncbi:MAG: 50S ribosomal protein L6 [Desulfobacterales bacterium]|nr:50S ribosomal protein L6 [Desulfobacterales bacterium]